MAPSPCLGRSLLYLQAVAQSDQILLDMHSYSSVALAILHMILFVHMPHHHLGFCVQHLGL